MPSRTLVFAACAVANLACAPAALADTVFMRNGDRLSGRILHMSGGTLTLKTSYAGKLTLDWKGVASVSTDEPTRLILEDRSVMQTGRLARTQTGHVLLHPTNPGGRERTIALDRVKFLNPTPSESGTGVEYSGHVTASGSRVQGNSSSSAINTEAALKARAKSYRYEIRGSANQASIGGQTVTSKWIASAHVDRFVVDPKHFQYLRGSVQHDRFTDIRLRTALGGGYGWQLIDTDSTKLSIRGGLDVVSVQRYANPGERYPAFGWGLRASHWLWGHRVEAFHVQDGYWNLKHRSNVTLRTRTGLRVPIAEGLLANAELDVDWERHPPPGVKPTDSTLLFGLGYEW